MPEPPASGLATAVAAWQLMELELDALTPNPAQPRAVFDDEELEELAASIREVGVLQPAVARRTANGYELVMGERRWRAARRAGLATIPVIVRDVPDRVLLLQALLENLQRVGLNPLEEAAGFQQLLADFDCTHDQLAAHLGKSRSYVSSTLRLLNLPMSVQSRVAAGVLSAGHARVLCAIRDPYATDLLAARIVAEGLSVRNVEEIVAVGNLPGAETVDGRAGRRRRGPHADAADLAQVATALSERFDTRVRLLAGRTRGRIVVEFSDRADLRRILDVLDQRPTPVPSGGAGQL